MVYRPRGLVDPKVAGVLALPEHDGFGPALGIEVFKQISRRDSAFTTRNATMCWSCINVKKNASTPSSLQTVERGPIRRKLRNG